MNIQKIDAGLLGCFELITQCFSDERGSFQKIFQRDAFEQLNLCTDWVEQYYSKSHYGVLRGMHFQAPPHDMAKLVYCVDGEVLDVILDLRHDSITYGQHRKIVLSAQRKNAIYIPSGFAHGFFTLSENATMIYNVSSEFVQSHDQGVRWDSFGVDWPQTPIQISSRDLEFPLLADFHTPFI